MKRIFLFAALVLATMIFTINCKHKPFPGPELPPDTGSYHPPVDTSKPIVIKDPCSPDSVYFKKDIAPIIASSCAMPNLGCHDANSSNDVILSTYSQIRARVKAGNPSNSKIYEVITTTDPGDKMPPSGHPALTSAQIAMIYKWIQQGAKNNTCTDTNCNANNFKFATDIQPLMELYCKGCHSGSSPSGNVGLSNYSEISLQAANGKLYNTVNHTSGYFAMPQGSPKLSNCQITQIKNWVDGGYPNN